MTPYLWIMLGSGIGGALRVWCTQMVTRYAGASLPFGTIAVNVIGCIFIGFFASYTGPDGKAAVSQPMRLFVMPGLCGGFTTFSTFSLETLLLAREGYWGRAGVNVAFSVVLCLAGVWLGYLIARKPSL